MLSSLIKTKNSKLVGIDIGTYNVKAVLLSKSGNGFKVESAVKMPLVRGAIVDNAINDVEAVGGVLKKLRREFPKQYTGAAAAISGSGVISKIVYLNSSQNEEDLESQIEIEAENLIPYPLDEVSLDFEVLGQNERDTSKSDVLLIASRTEQVEAHASAVELGGFKAQVIDVDGYALGRAFELVSHQFSEENKDKPVALIDIGASSMILSVLINGETVFTKEQAFGGEQYTHSIASYYDMQFAEAESAKINDELPRNYVFEVLAPFQTAMIQQIRRALQIYSTSKQGSEIVQLVISGGCSSMPAIDTLLSDELGIPTSIASPFSHCEVHKNIDFDSLNKEGSLYMIAAGLAMRSFC